MQQSFHAEQTPACWYHGGVRAPARPPLKNPIGAAAPRRDPRPFPLALTLNRGANHLLPPLPRRRTLRDMPNPDPVQPPDDDARALARRLLHDARHAALAFADPATGTPGISRIALAIAPDGTPLTLISGLAPHTAALRARPACAIMVGDPPDRGDPLTHPRLMVRAQAAFAPPQDRPALRGHWLALRPKAMLYVDLPDFAFVRLHIDSALLNGGFARAFRLTARDLQ